MRNKFDREMEDLNTEVKKMGAFIETAISSCMQALKNDDKELALNVYENDYVANELELSIERKSLRILLSEQPVAKDLRTISTALKMITDMERICDQAADIAEIVLNLEKKEEYSPSLLYQMAEKCVIMVNKSIDSFLADDLDLAKAVIESDDEFDRLFVKVHGELVDEIVKAPQESGRFLDYFMIAKYLERIGDHAQNIAEWVIFSITGEHKNIRIL
ncbi:MAG: phosphate signaling complex protein PhoU [Clostridia bacterium]|nr:phosphate signaling complex protein PhoU [Clostridia bacterium]